MTAGTPRSTGTPCGTPWTGGDAGPYAHCVLAGNPGPLTLEGTNTWVLSAPGSPTALVVDPGPDDDTHLRAVLDAVAGRGASLAQILLTHGHADHSEGTRRLAELSGAGVRAFDARHRLGGEGLQDGDRVVADDLVLEVVGTPGHSSDSLCFLLPATGAVLTGDTVLGRGTAVVFPPDGRLADYLASLERLRALAAGSGLTALLPGHGPVVDQPLAAVEYYRRHRLERLDQVRAAVAAGDRTAREVVARVYVDVDRALWPAAELSVTAQLDYLREAGGREGSPG